MKHPLYIDTNMAMMRIFEFMPDEFSILGIYSTGNYEHKWNTKLYNY